MIARVFRYTGLTMAAVFLVHALARLIWVTPLMIQERDGCGFVSRPNYGSWSFDMFGSYPYHDVSVMVISNLMAACMVGFGGCCITAFYLTLTTHWRGISKEDAQRVGVKIVLLHIYVFVFGQTTRFIYDVFSSCS